MVDKALRATLFRGAKVDAACRYRVAIEKTFEQAGFEVFYFGDMDVREQMAVMAGTELLAGFHGANLINLLFMPPGASVVEINSSGIPHNLYEGMADVAGLQYRRIMIGEPELENEKNRVLLAPDAAGL